MSRQPHVLVIPYPAQGHVAPLMKLATKIAERAIKVTVVNTEFIHKKIIASMQEKAEDSSSQIKLVTIPDGLELQAADREDPLKLGESVVRAMRGCLRDLIEKINQSNDCEPIRCVIADVNVGSALEVAESMGIARAALVPFGPGSLALSLQFPKLLEAGIIDPNGFAILNDGLISLSDEIPAWKRNEYTWSFPAEPSGQKILLGIICAIIQAVKISNWIINNSVYELDSPACDLIPNILPIGPLLASNHSGDLDGSFWSEDSNCLSWLDEQAIRSVVYVAFGSVAVLSQQQFEELALGLESLQKPFLWVVRQDFMNGSRAKFPDGFIERVSNRGKIVEWVPQEKVLGHSSVACFISHCGWNSTMEGLSMGVPFLCWPYFSDQYQNRNYICDAWKIGLQFFPDENGIITRQEIQRKVLTLLKNDDIRSNSLKLKEVARKSLLGGGSSFRNFESFISDIKMLISGCDSTL